jgi:hypothetical protein
VLRRPWTPKSSTRSGSSPNRKCFCIFRKWVLRHENCVALMMMVFSRFASIVTHRKCCPIWLHHCSHSSSE